MLTHIDGAVRWLQSASLQSAVGSDSALAVLLLASWTDAAPPAAVWNA